MQKKTINLIVPAFLVLTLVVSDGATSHAQAADSMYAAAAPLDRYLIPDRDSEIALARSAAPASISDGAEVLVLGRNGYTTAVKGGNGFVCLVERGFAAGTDFAEFWNPKIMGPACVNPAAARTYLPPILMKAKLVFEGKSKPEIAQAIRLAMESKQLPALEPGGMCFMMSKHQYLGDEGKSWHPHLMWFAPADAEKSWGADLPGSPVMATNDPEDRMTIFMVCVGYWSDGTPGPPDVP